VDRVLFVVRNPLDLRDSSRASAMSTVDDAQRALCVVRDGDDAGIGHLALQQQMTVELRAQLGDGAEMMAIFVVSDRGEDDVAACAAAWGATRVVEL
jgi:hypothetical protein